MNGYSEPILVLISADVEWQATKEILHAEELLRSPFGEYFVGRDFDFPKAVIPFQGGWGKISAAASTQYVIDHFSPSLLFNLGTCGGIAGKVKRGQVVLVEKTMVYDLIELMDVSDEAEKTYTTKLDVSFLRQPFPIEVVKRPMLSADRDLRAEDIPMLLQKYDAWVCDWESAAIAYVASKNQTPLVILRGVSDLVSQEGGEAYGNMAHFQQSAWEIMKQLLESLEGWLKKIDYDHLREFEA